MEPPVKPDPFEATMAQPEPWLPQRPSRPKKNTYKFYMGNNVHRQVVISSNFDSGNIELLRQVNQFYYRLAAVSDTGAQLARKTWFYFKVRAYRNCRLKLVVENVDVLAPAYEWQAEGCRPVCRKGEQGRWQLCQCYIARREELELHIQHTFQSDESVFFALSVPFSYENNYNFLKEIEAHASTVPQCYFKKELLTYSLNKRQVHLLTITHREASMSSDLQEERFDPKLFPENDRPLKFDKPVVLIGSRVHPGEVASSHCLTGMIRFLLNPKDLRAYLLRRLFVFMIVPMLNPDGVYDGNYRMDLLGRNLNRLYNNPDFSTEPQVYALRKLADHLTSDSRMYLYLDMHGHSSTKPAFVYGNALEDIVNQVENQLFCRLLAMNTRYFSYDHSNFTEENMAAKDRDELLTKQGCSRVCLGRLPSVMLSLTLEVGLHPIGRNLELPAPSNTDFSYEGFLYTERNRSAGIVEICQEIGEETMITLLDSVDKNPYSRLNNSTFKTIDGARRAVAGQLLQDEERFRRTDVRAYQKVRTIDKMAQQYFINKINVRWNYLYPDQRFCKYDWPVAGLKLLSTLRPAPAKQARRQKSPKKKGRPEQTSSTVQANSIEDETSQLKELKAPLPANSSKTALNPISIDFGLAETEQASARSRRPGHTNFQDVAAQLRRSGKIRQQEGADRPLLIVRELELPKLIRNMITYSQQDKLLDRQKNLSNSPAKKQLKREAHVETPSFLIGTDKRPPVHLDNREPPKKSRSKRKLSILQSLKRVEEEAEQIFANANNRLVDPYDGDSIVAQKRTDVRIKTENNTDEIAKSNKSTRRDLMTTEPNIIDEMMQRENQRYDRMMMAHHEIEDQRSRNIRDSRRELLNIKLRQFRKKGQTQLEPPKKQQPVLPSLRRGDQSQNEQFDDLAVRDHSRQLKQQHEAMSDRQVKLYISSRRVVGTKPTM